MTSSKMRKLYTVCLLSAITAALGFLIWWILSTRGKPEKCVLCEKSEGVCGKNEFDCEEGLNGTGCIPAHFRCDKVVHCLLLQKDEEDCDYQKLCPQGFILCKNGNCVHRDLKCDRVNDCGDESDEEDCSSSVFTYQCPDQENWFRCTKASCIPIKQRCDGNVDCPEEDDEMNCSKDASHCRRDEFLCDLHRCIPLTMKCDGVPDCRDGTDEPVDCKFAPPEDDFVKFRSRDILESKF